MRNPKILILTPTYEGKDYCLEEFLSYCKEIDYDNYYHLWVDNTIGLSYTEKLKGLGLNVVHIERGNTAREAMSRSQEYGRRFALANGFDYMLSLESDVMPLPDCIERLMKHQLPVVGALYNIGNEGIRVPCITVSNKTKLGLMGTRLLEPEELNNYWDNAIKQVNSCGLGCTLIRKDVLKDTMFNFMPHLRQASDVLWANRVAMKGYPIFVDTTLFLFHRNNNATSTNVKDR